MSQMSAKAPSRAASRQSAVIVVSGSDFVIIRGTWCRCVYWCSTHARRMAPRRVRLQSALPLGVLLLSAPRAVRVLSAGYTGLMLRETARTRLKAPFACSRRPAFCRERAASHKKCPVFARPLFARYLVSGTPSEGPHREGSFGDAKNMPHRPCESLSPRPAARCHRGGKTTARGGGSSTRSPLTVAAGRG